MVWDAQHAVKTESLKATLHPFFFKRKKFLFLKERELTFVLVIFVLLVQNIGQKQHTGGLSCVSGFWRQLEQLHPRQWKHTHLVHIWPMEIRDQAPTTSVAKIQPSRPSPHRSTSIGPHLLKAHNLPKHYHQLTTKCSRHSLWGTSHNQTVMVSYLHDHPGSTSEMHLGGLGR